MAKGRLSISNFDQGQFLRSIVSNGSCKKKLH
jgi:hypothetical protein